MSEEWFYAKQDKEFGPFSSAQMKRLGAMGQIEPTDLVWKAGMVKRVPARAVKGLCSEASRAAAPPAAAPPPPKSPPAPPPAEFVEALPVETPSTATHAVLSTQVEEMVALVPVEIVPPPAPLAQAPPALPPLVRGIPVVEIASPQTYLVEEEAHPTHPLQRPQGGSGTLWSWGNMTESEVMQILGPPASIMNVGMGKQLVWRSGANVITVNIFHGRVAHLDAAFGDSAGGHYP